MLQDMLYCILDQWQQFEESRWKSEAKMLKQYRREVTRMSGRGETELKNIQKVKLVIFLVKEK